MPKISISSFELGDHDKDWFIVMCRLGGRSIRANLSSVVGYYVRRRKKEYEEILAYTARKYGITEDECFRQALTSPRFPEGLTPVEGFDENAPELEDEG